MLDVEERCTGVEVTLMASCVRFFRPLHLLGVIGSDSKAGKLRLERLSKMDTSAAGGDRILLKTGDSLESLFLILRGLPGR